MYIAIRYEWIAYVFVYWLKSNSKNGKNEFTAQVLSNLFLDSFYWRMANQPKSHNKLRTNWHLWAESEVEVIKWMCSDYYHKVSTAVFAALTNKILNANVLSFYRSLNFVPAIRISLSVVCFHRVFIESWLNSRLQ